MNKYINGKKRRKERKDREYDHRAGCTNDILTETEEKKNGIPKKKKDKKKMRRGFDG